jgi:lipocalin
MKFSTLTVISSVCALISLSKDPKTKLDALEVNKFVGGWFEIGRTNLISQTIERNCDCVEANYTALSDGIEVVNTCVRNKVPDTITGKAVQVNKNSISELKVSFKQSNSGFFGDIGLFFQNCTSY